MNSVAKAQMNRAIVVGARASLPAVRGRGAPHTFQLPVEMGFRSVTFLIP